MNVLLAVEPSRASAGALRMLDRVFLPPGSDLFILSVRPLPQNVSGLVKERILKKFKPTKTAEKESREQVLRGRERIMDGAQYNKKFNHCPYYSTVPESISTGKDFH